MTMNASTPGRPIEVSLKVSPQERVASAIVALLAILGAAVVVLLLLWFTWAAVASIRPVEIAAVELKEPGSDDIAIDSTVDDAIVTDFQMVTPPLSSSLSALGKHLQSDELNFDAMSSSFAGRSGPKRGRGPGGEGDADIVPFGQRIEIRYNTASPEEYAKQLDFFGIELAALGGGNPQVEYARAFSNGATQVRRDSGEKENRVYLTWRPGSQLEDMDRQLLARGGIDTAGRVVVQFLPLEIEQLLKQLEHDYAKGRPVEQVRKTVYQVKPVGRLFQFEVIDQDYR